MIGPNGLPLQSGHHRQGENSADIGAGSDMSRKDAQRDARRDADHKKGDRFGKALDRALAAQQPRDDDRQPSALAFAPLQILPAPTVTPDGPPPPAQVQQHSHSIAERIDRYLRSAEAQGGLRDGQSMQIRLPTGPMGLSQVTVTMQDGVLRIALSMEAAATGMRAQLAILGQAISQRQPKLAFQLSVDEAEEAAANPTEPFNPLMPQRKPG